MNKARRFLLTVIFCCSCASVSASAEDAPVLGKGRYFTVRASSGIEPTAVLNKLQFDYFAHPESMLAADGADAASVLAKTLDSLYSEVSDILDIHMYSFEGAVVIVADQAAVAREFRALFGTDFAERSFYLADKNTIYISYKDLALGMLGHEIAHAIMTRYFVVATPAKVQEVLAGYVEYSLRKSRGSLK
jgi:hypothetical protein